MTVTRWVVLTAGSLLVAGCASGGSSPGAGSAPPAPGGNAVTAVTLMVTSAANDQLSEFDIEFQGIVLTNASGATVSLLTPSKSQAAEFIHVNGGAEPLLTASVPSDVYTSATVTVGTASFDCVSLSGSGGLVISEYVYGQTPASDVTVTLPAPIAVSGASMGLALNMLVTQSAAYAQCQGGSVTSRYAITPTFTLTSFALPAAAPGAASVSGLDGQITVLDSSAAGFELQLPGTLLPKEPATSLHVATDSATVWQGSVGFGALAMGTFVDLDGAMQADGSLLATRIAIVDPGAVNVQRGPILFISNAVPLLDLYPRQGEGKDMRIDTETFKFDGSTFEISGQLSNLQTLPFTPSFNGTNMVAGQNVSISSGAFARTGNFDAAATTITLMPQTINGAVVGTASSGGFTIYSVALAADDLFPALATQPGQNTLLIKPGVVEVYVDHNAAMRNSSPVIVGTTIRFYGLVFNDNGVLRMDCAAISDGVVGSSQTLSPIT